MKKLDKIIRIVTIPPIVTGIMVVLLFACSHSIGLRDFIVSEVCLLVIPCLAYPYGTITAGNKDKRESQRNAALVFSGFGYTIGFVWTIFLSTSPVMKVLFTAYMISIIMLLIINKGIKFKASGHACSTTAPIIMLTWQMGYAAIIPGLLLIAAVYYSSLKLRRHTLPQLITGSCISVAAVVIAAFIIRA